MVHLIVMRTRNESSSNAEAVNKTSFIVKTFAQRRVINIITDYYVTIYLR
jgi:hypothetical protein